MAEIIVRSATRPEEVRQRAGHTLFVEGSGENAIDPEILRLLLDDTGVRVERMGPSFHVRSAAEALHPHHPDYYFLVDRDHNDDATVERSWTNFPDEGHHNLLIWRRREFENYFLSPDYLRRSRYVTCDSDQLKSVILQEANTRIWLEISNLVILEIREHFKRARIALFTTLADFQDKQTAETKLLTHPDFETFRSDVASRLVPEFVRERFESFATMFCAEEEAITFGRGRWLELVRGKAILNTVISKCFRVYDLQGKRVQGHEALMAVARELIRLPLSDQPDDFRDLHSLIQERSTA